MISDSDPSMPIHGGDLDWAERQYGRPAEGWVDLSTGINPWPYLLPEIAQAAWTRLPGAAATRELLAAAAQCYGVADPAQIVPAPGSQSLIQALPDLWPPGRVAVVSPTYGEHAMAWRAAGHEIIECTDPREGAGLGDIVVLTNPNNPDGRTRTAQELDAIADDLNARGGALIVDEAFADLRPELSLAPAAARPGRIVLRSFGKFYGLAGLRLGFALAGAELAERIRQALGPWPVSGPAIAVGTRALSDRAWAEETRRHLREASAALTEMLQEEGLSIVGGTDLFVLAWHEHAAAVHERLARAGIYVRRFADRPDWLRFGLPPDGKAIERLRSALRPG